MVILAVDDERAQLELMVEEIRSVEANAEIHPFHLPMDALAYIRENNVDVIFLDIHMPQMGGIEMAKEIKKIKPTVNVIFATAYDDFSYDAFQVHASGYIMKPVSGKQIAKELENLRYPVVRRDEGIRVTTFGPFDIYVNGESIHFGRAKSKEVLAYLIDKRGAGVTKKELAAAIFEDREYSRSTQDYINKILREMEKALKDANATEIYVKKMNYYAVDPSKFRCDMYDYIDGNVEGINAFRGEYMTQYSWAEDSIGEFL
ncbi:MAG: response regulator [Agathobacter sp.]|uniref:response regulator n=1 Tax=Agathobacter sp. TaxID=2021311 RepID=UPI00258DF054|nr:response regulator [Agathobacter sp.]MCR5676682.1 response regulator [Agathobacter sp.]